MALPRLYFHWKKKYPFETLDNLIWSPPKSTHSPQSYWQNMHRIFSCWVDPRHSLATETGLSDEKIIREKPFPFGAFVFLFTSLPPFGPSDDHFRNWNEPFWQDCRKIMSTSVVLAHEAKSPGIRFKHKPTKRFCMYTRQTQWECLWFRATRPLLIPVITHADCENGFDTEWLWIFFQESPFILIAIASIIFIRHQCRHQSHAAWIERQFIVIDSKCHRRRGR